MQSRNAYILGSFVIPEGAGPGELRIEFDAENGRILVYDASDTLIGSISPDTGLDGLGNTIQRGLTSYQDPTEYAQLVSSRLSLVRGVGGDTVTSFESGLIQYTEDGFVDDTFQMYMDSQRGMALRHAGLAGIARRTVWNGANGYLYAGDNAGASPFDVEDWHAVAFQNAWADWGAPYATVQYKLDALGWVNLQGVARPGVVASGTIVFNLPAGFRPSANHQFHYYGLADSILEVRSTGDVAIINHPGAAAALSITGFRFPIV